VPSPRWQTWRGPTTARRRCRPLADLLPERTAPALRYREAPFAALMSDGVTVDVLGALVPMGAQRKATTGQRPLRRVAERREPELGEAQAMGLEGCPAEWARLPPPRRP
jgi:hypothetical protein